MLCLDSKSCTNEVVALEGVSSMAGDEPYAPRTRFIPCAGDGSLETSLEDDVGSRGGVDFGVPDLEVASKAAA